MCLVQSRKFLHLLLPIEFQLDFFVPKASADENEIIPKKTENQKKKERKKRKEKKMIVMVNGQRIGSGWTDDFWSQITSESD